jgi:predicted dehydrogenase
MTARNLSRREFAKDTAAAAIGAGVMLSAGPFVGDVRGANEKLILGLIGCGGRGRKVMGHFLETGEAEAAAVCDVYAPHLEKARAMTDGKAEAFHDFRDLLKRKDLDAVIVGTPDHWHALPTILACQAGLDVYVEKPLALTVEEGRRMVEAARAYDRIVQVGTQQRSSTHFQQAVRLVSSGHLGKVSYVKTWNVSNRHPEGIGNPPDSDPPEGLDWELWQGPAPRHPYNPNRCIYNFRWFWDYAGGKLTDWGTHLIDIVHWAMGEDAPLAVSAAGGKFYLEDNRETPDTLEVTYQYPGFILTYTNRECNGHKPDGHGYGILFHGTDGTLFVDRGGFEVWPEDGRCEPVKSEGSEQNVAHVKHFIQCVKTRERPISDVETGHRSTSAPHLGNIAYHTGRRIQWDAKEEQIIGDSAAQRMLSRRYHRPWELPKIG